MSILIPHTVRYKISLGAQQKIPPIFKTVAWCFIDDYGRYVKIVRKYKIAIQRNTRPRGDSSTYISFFIFQK